MNRFTKRLCSFFTAAALILSAAASVSIGEGQTIALKKSSILTLDRDNSGYVRGIWGTTTAGELADEFEGNVEIRSGDAVLDPGAYVSADDTVYLDGESMPVLIYGDAGRDGKVNLTDAAIILKAVAQWDVELCSAAADVTMNGKSDLGDVSTLLKWIAGWDVTLGDAVFPAVEFSLSDFSVVVPEYADKFEMETAELIAEALDSIYSQSKENSRIITDAESAALEILIGGTSRARTAEASAELDEFGWTYAIPSDRTVVIAGADSIGTYEAAEAFLWDLFGYVNKHNRIGSYTLWNGSEYVDVTTSKNVTAGTVCVFDYTPSSDELTIGGRDIGDYVIVAPNADAEAAQVLRRAIMCETGDELEIVPQNKADSSPAIRIGVGRSGGGNFDGISNNVFAIGIDGDDIVIDTKLHTSNLFAARTFVKWYIDERIPLDEDEVQLAGTNSNLLRLSESAGKILADGVTYSELKYTDSHGLPVMAYLVEVENGAERIMMGMPDNGTAVSGVKATVMEAIEAAEADGADIVAGINADFFHIESDYSPVGLCVKDGVILKQNTETKPWIAVMKDGSLSCGIAGEARQKINDMKHGFGASHVLLTNGMVYQDGQGDSFGEIRHPRTAMGYDADGTVYLLVVDGRQPKHSNGASLLDLTLMFKEFGATCAVNLDGGGSTTMIVDDGGFDVKNSPSDGSLRSIFNSVLITE